MNSSDWCLVLIFMLSMLGYLIFVTGAVLKHMKNEDDIQNALGCPFAVYMFALVWLTIILLFRWKQLAGVSLIVIIGHGALGVLSGIVINSLRRYYFPRDKSQG